MPRRLFPLFLALLALAGCSTVCDEAIEVLERECLMTVEREPDIACEGEQKGFSQCIVDHPRSACAYYDDPVGEADNEFARCIDALP